MSESAITWNDAKVGWTVQLRRQMSIKKNAVGYCEHSVKLKSSLPMNAHKFQEMLYLIVTDRLCCNSSVPLGSKNSHRSA